MTAQSVDWGPMSDSHLSHDSSFDTSLGLTRKEVVVPAGGEATCELDVAGALLPR